jgi:hypothetical protein
LYNNEENLIKLHAAEAGINLENTTPTLRQNHIDQYALMGTFMIIYSLQNKPVLSNGS